MTLQKEFRTYEQMCLDKLKEIGSSSVAEWSMAMGYSSPNGVIKVIKRIQRTDKLKDKLKVYDNKKPRRYEAR
jgi:hypothetical protein